MSSPTLGWGAGEEGGGHDHLRQVHLAHLLKKQDGARMNKAREGDLHGDGSRHVREPLVETTKSVENQRLIRDWLPDIAERWQESSSSGSRSDCHVALNEHPELNLKIENMCLLIVEEDVCSASPKSTRGLIGFHDDLEDFLGDGAIEPC